MWASEECQQAKGTACHPAHPRTAWTRCFFDLQTQSFLYTASLELSQANINIEEMQRFYFLFLDAIIKDFRSSQIAETGTHYCFQLPPLCSASKPVFRTLFFC